MNIENFLYWDLNRRGFESKWLSIGELRIHYLKRDSSSTLPPLIFLHGISASALHWYLILIGLADLQRTILVVDLPGHGLSSIGREPLTPQHLQSIFARWVSETTGGKKIVLVGNSLGGSLALQFALANQIQVSSMFLISPAVGIANSEEWENLKRLFIVDSQSEARNFFMRIIALPRWLVSTMGFITSKRVLEQMNQKAVKDLLTHSQASDFRPATEMALLSVPTVFIWGTHDWALPKSCLEWLRTNLPSGSVLEEPRGIGHCPQLDHPRWLLARLREFLIQSEKNQQN